MDNFANPHAQEQTGLINAAMYVFGQNGYKKTSVADITARAGVAKGMVNYYFGSKKNLYLYLAELAGTYMVDELERQLDKSVVDFFDNIKMMTEIKISLIRQYPAIFSFLRSFYMEKAPEVSQEVQAFLANSQETREKWLFADFDSSRFKDDVDVRLISTFFVWAAEGAMAGIGPEMSMAEIEAFTADMFACLDMMRKHFYR